MIRTFAFICAFLLSIGAVLYSGHQLREQANQDWMKTANQDVERVTNTGVFWLSLFHAQLRGIGAVFQASSEVTEDELFDALETTEAIEAAIPISTLAFVVPVSQDEYITTMSTDLSGTFEKGANLSGNQAARRVVDAALATPENVVMSSVFLDEADRRWVLLAFAASNAEIQGAILTPVGLDEFFGGLNTLYAPKGIDFRLVELSTAGTFGTYRKMIMGNESPVAETVKTIQIITASGGAQWEFNWDVLPGYQDGPDTGLADVVQGGGIVLAVLTFGIIGLLFIQNRRINRRVFERTVELQRATEQAEKSAGELANTLEISEGLRKDADLARSEAESANEELKVALETAEIARQEAESANQSKSTFLANMSHEIRTPMNAILGFTEILHSLINDSQQQQYLSSIQTSGKSLLTLINDILDLSKVEAGKLDIQYGPVNLPVLAQDMDMIFSPKVFEKNLNFIVDIDDDLPEVVMLDETRLRQILVNVIGNAIKFTSEGQVKLTISALQRENVEHPILIFAVADTGIGIAKNQQDKVFGAFEQQKGQSINEYGGTGLGLAISKRLTEMMKGEILLESEEGRGSTFTVIFHDVEVLQSEGRQIVEENDTDHVIFEPATIVVADDVRLDREIIRGHLAPYPLTVFEAENGSEALELVKTKRPNLVLLDIKMPVLDGFKTAQLIKGQEELKRVPIVALTTSAMRETVEEISLFFDGYLAKPFTKSPFIREIARFLEHQIEAPTPTSAESIDSNGSMDSDALARLPELIQILENEQPSVAELASTLTINDIEAFASRMQTLSVEFGCPALQSWANTLAEQTTLFDMDAMANTLNGYSSTVDVIRAIEA